MKILMLGWELPPDNSGGLGVACYQLCKALSKKDVDIHFILPFKHSGKVDFMKVRSVSPEHVNLSEISGVYDSLGFADGQNVADSQMQRSFEQTVSGIVMSEQFDIIHAHDWLTFRAAMKAKMLSNLPLIVHLHSIEHDRAGGKRGNPFVHDIEEAGLLMADRIVAVSEKTKADIVREYGIPAEKIMVVHNNVDPEEMAELDSENAYRYLSAMRGQGYKVVANVGRLTLQKGLSNFLHVAKEVVARLPKTIFLIVGDGEQLHELMMLAADLGIARNVIFTGFQRGKNWRDAFAIADLFMMPSVSEPFGIAPLEALHYGTPSLISKQSGVSEIMKNSLKVDFWDVNEMANQVVAALRSNEMLDELTRNALREVDGFGWGEAANKTVDIYNMHLQGAAA